MGLKYGVTWNMGQSGGESLVRKKLQEHEWEVVELYMIECERFGYMRMMVLFFAFHRHHVAMFNGYEISYF